MLSKQKNYFSSAIIGIIVKVAIIASGFIILKTLNIFPEKLVSNLQKAMTVTQLITASIGAVISYGIYKLEEK